MQLLLCTGGGLQSAGALALGARLACLWSSLVTILGVVESPEREDKVRQELGRTSSELIAHGIECNTVMRPGLLHQAVVTQAAVETYDLIVVGAMEQGWFQRWLRGPSTRRILSAITAPVLIVPAERPAIQRILMCGGDLWYPEEMVAWVQRLGSTWHAEVTLLYVVTQPQLNYPLLREVEDAWGALLQTDTPQGRNLKACRDTLHQANIETSVKLRHGLVIEQILAEVREGEYDLIVIGSTYASQSLRRYFVESVTDAVVEQADRPVLVVRHRGEPPEG